MSEQIEDTTAEDVEVESNDSGYEMPSENLFEEVPQEEATEVVEEAPIEETEDQQPVSDIVTIDGNEYSLEDVRSWQDAFSNKENWQKTNTQRAQELAEQERSLQDFRKEFDEFKTAQERAAKETDLSDEDLQARKWLQSQGFVPIQDVERMVKEELSKTLSPIQQQTEILAQAQSDAQLVQEMETLMDKYSISEDEALDVADFALANNLHTLSLDQVYLIKNQDNILEVMKQNAKQDAEKNLERKQKAGRVLSTKGARTTGKSLQYNPKTDRNKSVYELYQENL